LASRSSDGASAAGLADAAPGGAGTGRSGSAGGRVPAGASGRAGVVGGVGAPGFGHDNRTENSSSLGVEGSSATAPGYGMLNGDG
jgi:hypothetical protein